MNNKTLGNKGEELACDFFIRKGMKIIARNYRFDRAEIDIVALDGNELVFAEVKTRRTVEFGTPEQAVTKRKLSQIIKAAQNFLQENENQIKFDSVRFDVVAILFDKEKTKIEHFENVEIF